jgi:hypothetical protein
MSATVMPTGPTARTIPSAPLAAGVTTAPASKSASRTSGDVIDPGRLVSIVVLLGSEMNTRGGRAAAPPIAQREPSRSLR